MTFKQKFLAFLYPVTIFLTKMVNKNVLVFENTDYIMPSTPFYSLKAQTINGQEVLFSQYKGRKVLLVNVASECGYTFQYKELEELSQRYKGKLIVLGFPSNDFKEQEPGTDEMIEHFCKVNFGVTFPLFKKFSVTKPGQNEVFQWLSDSSKNGWNDKQPTWNFCKYLVDEKGVLTHFFEASVSPAGFEMMKALRVDFKV